MLRSRPATSDSGWYTSISICINPPSIAWSFSIRAWRPAACFVLDDYGHLTCPGVRQAVDEFFRDKPETVIESVCGTSFVFKSD